MTSPSNATSVPRAKRTELRSTRAQFCLQRGTNKEDAKHMHKPENSAEPGQFDDAEVQDCGLVNDRRLDHVFLLAGGIRDQAAGSRPGRGMEA